MSFKIGGFLNSLGGDNAVSTPPLVANKPVPERYAGGTLTVAIKLGDTQEKFVHRALYDHAITAGLGKTEAKEFADKWTSHNTTFNHRANGSSTPYTPKEFQNLKAKGTAAFDLTKEFDADILADLNKRVDDNTIIVQANPAYTIEERAAMLAQKQASASQSAIADKPIMIMIDGTTKDGKPIDADTALTRYIQRTYNPATSDGSRRVWGDKINEMVSQAKTDGVQVNLQFNEDGTALVGVNEANKQKLDGLFNQALGDTILGEKGSEKAQKEETGQVVDIPIMAINGVVNTANHVTEPVRGTLETFGVDTSAAKIPKIPYQSEYGKKNGVAGEIGTEVGLGVVSAPALLKTAAGKVVMAISGVYNVSTGAAGVDPTEKGEDGKFREMGKLESDLRIVGGAAEVFGAKPVFKDTAIAGKTAQRTEEVIEALTPNGQVIKVQVPKSAQTATEAATAKPLQTVDDLVLEMRGEHRINIRKGDGTKSSGMEYAWRRHGGSGSAINKSQFSVTREEVEAILQRKDVIADPAVLDSKSGNYIRQVDVGKTIGNIPLKQGGHPTSVITIITDEAGNLVNVFPGRLDYGATLK